MFGDFGDFGFGRRSRSYRTIYRGSDLRYDIGLDDAFTGTEKNISYTTYKNAKPVPNGAKPGSKPTFCSYCNGQGKVRSSQGFFTIQQTCPECSMKVKIFQNPCSSCSGIGKIQSNESVFR